MLTGASASQAQDITAGDPAGWFRWGFSNTFGYGLKGARGQGYMPGLYMPIDAGNGPGVYYSPIFTSFNGAPSPEVASRGWGFSPPGSAAYRQGEPRKHRLLGRLHRRHQDE
ncbi:MAG: hypothetical protein JWN86_1447 [Planctomycetota bacterium]|nr:hypothetical protein [Planctomycetota bacterium]